MAGNDIDRENQASGLTQITGRDEQYKANVVLDTDGQEKLLVKTDSIISSDLEIEVTAPNTTIGAGWVTLTNRNTTTRLTLSGFVCRFNDPRVEVRLTLDGKVLFQISCDILDDIVDVDQAPSYGTYVYWNNARDVFTFAPNFPISAFTNITIEARRVSGGNKTLSHYLTQIGETP